MHPSPKQALRMLHADVDGLTERVDRIEAVLLELVQEDDEPEEDPTASPKRQNKRNGRKRK